MIDKKQLTLTHLGMSSPPVVVTDQNVDEVEQRFHSLSKNDPEFKTLGDALHRYMTGGCTWDFLGKDDVWIGTHLYGRNPQEALAGFLEAFADPNEALSRIYKIERFDF